MDERASEREDDTFVSRGTVGWVTMMDAHERATVAAGVGEAQERLALGQRGSQGPANAIPTGGFRGLLGMRWLWAMVVVHALWLVWVADSNSNHTGARCDASQDLNDHVRWTSSSAKACFGQWQWCSSARCSAGGNAIAHAVSDLMSAS